MRKKIEIGNFGCTHPGALLHIVFKERERETMIYYSDVAFYRVFDSVSSSPVSSLFLCIPIPGRREVFFSKWPRHPETNPLGGVKFVDKFADKKNRQKNHRQH